MFEPASGRQAPRATAPRRATFTAVLVVAAAGFLVGLGSGGRSPEAALRAQAGAHYSAVRIHGYPVVNPATGPAHANRPATAGSNTAVDPLTGRLPEDAPYTDPTAPFDPFAAEAPEMDVVTWNPAWISERLGDPALRAQWPGLVGIDEVSAAAHIRAGGRDASEKVWLRHWYEPQHLDKDLNADGRLTDADNNGEPDAPVNPVPSAIDEWYPAIMAELSYVLTDNDPLPAAAPAPDDLHRSAPRPVCGAAGDTRFVFPVGVAAAETEAGGPAVGHGLTSLDADFDGRPDMVRVSNERALPGLLAGMRLDFDGDGQLDTFNTNGGPLDCDEMVVLHTESIVVPIGGKVQLLDHFLAVRAVNDNSAVLDVWNTGGLTPRFMQTRTLGRGAALLAGDSGPLQVVPAGGSTLGAVPPGPWFAYVVDVDPSNGTAVILVGRALGAPCAAMEAAPGQANLTAGGPWFLKRFYVDGHEYNTVAIGTCPTGDFQFITLRTPLPKVPVVIEQHSVQLQGYAIVNPANLPSLPLPPPFNHEHTILEDVRAFESFAPVQVPPGSGSSTVPRPTVLYMGGPIGPVAPVLGADTPLPYTGRNPARPVGPYADRRATWWTYVHESRDRAMLGQLREKYGAAPPGAQAPGQATFFYNEQVFTLPWNFTEFFMPDLPDPAGSPKPFDPDRYHIRSAFTNPTARWRRWTMPDGPVPAVIPPTPPDLTANVTPDGGAPLGAPRRAAFWFDPDTPPGE
ncbi:MAG: hypothetical protein DYG90_09255, partial [Chloroflexi bacterium CFX6]|nr:hypothetical protein [Chloroflexi bacterium CFX6]